MQDQENPEVLNIQVIYCDISDQITTYIQVYNILKVMLTNELLGSIKFTD